MGWRAHERLEAGTHAVQAMEQRATRAQRLPKMQAREVRKARAVARVSKKGMVGVSDARTIVVPSMVLNYEDNILKSVSIGGVHYRKQREWRAIARSYKETIERMSDENAKLRDALKSLIMGTNAELCIDRDEPNCKECSMHHGKDGCTVVDAMKLLGIDIYGEPLEVMS